MIGHVKFRIPHQSYVILTTYNLGQKLESFDRAKLGYKRSIVHLTLTSNEAATGYRRYQVTGASGWIWVVGRGCGCARAKSQK